MKKAATHELLKELESNLVPNDYILPSLWTNMTAGCIVDVMAYVRKIPLSSISDFGDLFGKFLDMALGICKNAQHIDFVFDSYIEGSVKDNERQRCTLKSQIQVSDISRDTKLPKDMDTFWPSSNNKMKLENFLRSCIMNISHKIIQIHTLS